MNKNIFEVMVEMQHEFNKKVAVDYLEKNFNWNSAIIAESGELLESLGYKWWKKQEPDMENVKVEAIDLLHFVISEVIQEKGISKCISYLKYWFKDDYLYSLKEYEYNTIEQLISLFISSSDNRFLYLKMIFRKLEMSNEDVYIAFITKNCLNKFRQDNGYKDGTYIKDWNGKEDNVVAFEIANEWGADEELFEQLYKDLETYYNKEVLKDKKELHLSNILNDINYTKAVDTEVGE
ncbi:dUTP diphosphatase [Aliarcobacter butzleri]|uniref:dUTP diphosphatase n=1 Tax=Aliarcobacter butzleri TaxID=28197 RepID=UPI0028771F1B|nr:dUTP diphosphatase [Aliarcobacter butzleri]MDS1370679.1 dUTP diphosphatase [Aliarcobacter butzleri]